MTKFILTEKKDQADKIAAALGWKKGKGCYIGTLEGEETKVTWARGHLTTLLEPGEVIEDLGWNNPEELVPIPRTIDIKVIDDVKGAHPNTQAKSYIRNIRQHLKGASEFIIATDSDREGEAIGWNVIRILNYKGPVRRAWLAAGLDKKSIIEAFSNLRPPHITKSWYRASEARNQSDWSTMFLVRAYTYYASYGVFGKYLGRGSNSRSRVMSVGRVQTSALAMLVRRELEINRFTPKDHFKISLLSNCTPPLEAKYNPMVTQQIINNSPSGVVWETSKTIPEEGKEPPLDTPLFIGKKEINQFKNRLLENGLGTISYYKEKERLENPPKTFSLTDAQSEIGSALSISAPMVQIILEDLYEQGWTSYARTSKSELPNNFYEPEERNGLLDNLSNLSEVNQAAILAKTIHDDKHTSIRAFKPSVFTNKQLEHHGILPTHQKINDEVISRIEAKKKEKGKILHTSDQMQKSFLIVCKQFIQTLLPPAKYAAQEITISCDCEDILGLNTSTFTAKGERIVEPGWRAAFNKKADKDTTISKYERGSVININDIILRSAKTKPPARYNEKTFPKAMENIGKEVRDPIKRKRLKNSEGIGTPATRKTIVETLLVREYAKVKSGSYHATPKGEELINAVPSWLKTPETTAIWEDYLVKLCEEKNDQSSIEMRDTFIQKQVDSIEKLIYDLIDDYKGKLGERLEVRNTPTRVSENMKKAISSIEKRKGIKAPSGARNSPKIASMFLNEHLDKKSVNDNTPTDGQIKFAKILINNCPDDFDISENTLTDRKVCAEFIEKAKCFSPPSEGQLKYAKSLWYAMNEDERPELSVLNTASGCSEFIDKSKKSTPPSDAQLRFARKLYDDLPEDEKPDISVLNSAGSCSKFIDRQTKDWKSKKPKTKTRRNKG